MGYFGQEGRDFGTLRRGMGLFEDLGAVSIAELSVKYYPTAGGWASYQSPAADASLRGINTALAALGFPSSYDGIIRQWTADAIKLVAWKALQPVIKDWVMLAGGPVGGAGTRLATLTTPELIAKHGNEALWALQGLAAHAQFRGVMALHAKQSGIGMTSTITPTPTTPLAPLPPGAPTPGAGGGLVATLKSPVGLAAIGVAAMLVYTMSRPGGRRRRR